MNTPQSTEYTGKRFRGKVRNNTPDSTKHWISNLCCLGCVQLCGVSILRAGEVLEPALLSVCKDATLGKILIQSNPNTGEPEVKETCICVYTLWNYLSCFIASLSSSSSYYCWLPRCSDGCYSSNWCSCHYGHTHITGKAFHSCVLLTTCGSQ